MSKSMRVLLIDDDPVFAATLARALGRRRIDTALAHNADTALEQAVQWQPSHVLLDLNLGGDISGLDLIAPLCERVADVRITVLTGYASIATTVTAMQRGAVGYLAKPVDAPTVLAALAGENDSTASDTPGKRMSLKRLEWEHIQRVLAEHDGNISEAARSLGLHRRTLQRKLDKKPVKF
ncbi:response regulator transcription factor [Salinisphaera shabanensis]|nr:response regulator [Salinisphaera shabanensis]